MRTVVHCVLVSLLSCLFAFSQNTSKLTNVKKIYIGDLGREEGSDLVREKLRLALMKSDVNVYQASGDTTAWGRRLNERKGAPCEIPRSIRLLKRGPDEATQGGNAAGTISSKTGRGERSRWTNWVKASLPCCQQVRKTLARI